MTYTTEQLAAVAGMDINLFLTKVKGTYGDQIPQVHQWNASTRIENDIADVLLDWLGLDEERQSIQQLDETKITQADQAVVEAKYKLTQALKVNLQEVLDVQLAQAELLGEAAGVQQALALLDGQLRGQQTILNDHIDETMGMFEEQLNGIDIQAITHARRATGYLAESVRKKAVTGKKLDLLRERVKRLTTTKKP